MPIRKWEKIQALPRLPRAALSASCALICRRACRTRAPPTYGRRILSAHLRPRRCKVRCDAVELLREFPRRGGARPKDLARRAVLRIRRRLLETVRLRPQCGCGVEQVLSRELGARIGHGRDFNAGALVLSKSPPLELDADSYARAPHIKPKLLMIPSPQTTVSQL